MTNKLKIYTESTPNPNALKFVIDRVLLADTTANFPNKESAFSSPLAQKIFEIEAVDEVFIGRDFITVSKSQEVIWESIYDLVLKTISECLESGEPVLFNTDSGIQTSDDKIVQKILDILDNQIRPAVAGDGGDVVFDSYKDGILRLHLQGACSHCPSSIMTLKVGIEQMLKKHIPELKEVVSV